MEASADAIIDALPEEDAGDDNEIDNTRQDSVDDSLVQQTSYVESPHSPSEVQHVTDDTAPVVHAHNGEDNTTTNTGSDTVPNGGINHIVDTVEHEQVDTGKGEHQANEQVDTVKEDHQTNGSVTSISRGPNKRVLQRVSTTLLNNTNAIVF